MGVELLLMLDIGVAVPGTTTRACSIWIPFWDVDELAVGAQAANAKIIKAKMSMRDFIFRLFFFVGMIFK